MEQRKRRRQAEEKQQPQQQNEQTIRAGESPERQVQHDYGERKGWHEKPLPSGGKMRIYDGF